MCVCVYVCVLDRVRWRSQGYWVEGEMCSLATAEYGMVVVLVVAFSSITRKLGEYFFFMNQSPPVLFFFFYVVETSSCKTMSLLSKDMFTLALRTEMTVAEHSLTSCA